MAILVNEIYIFKSLWKQILTAYGFVGRNFMNKKALLALLSK